MPAVYTAAHLSLAVLEMFVHVSASADLPADLVAIAADLPSDLLIEHVRVEDLPRDWRRIPAPAALADRGTAWLSGARTAVLAVPSAVVPPETNYLLNPLILTSGASSLVARSRSTSTRAWVPGRERAR